MLIPPQTLNGLFGRPRKHLLVFYAAGLGNVHCEHRRVEPRHRLSADLRIMQPRFDGNLFQLIRRPAQHGRTAELGLQRLTLVLEFERLLSRTPGYRATANLEERAGEPPARNRGPN